MLQTDNLRSIMRMLRSKREFGLRKRHDTSDPEPVLVREDQPAPLPPTDPSFSRKRTSTSVTGPDVQLNAIDPITFKRHACCYKKEISTLAPEQEKEPEGGPSPVPSRSSPVDATGKTERKSPTAVGYLQISSEPPAGVHVMRVHSNVLLQYWEKKPTSEGRHAGEYSIIAQPSLRIDKNEFISHHRFKQHSKPLSLLSPSVSLSASPHACSCHSCLGLRVFSALFRPKNRRCCRDLLERLSF
jgi:hypothetical protein